MSRSVSHPFEILYGGSTGLSCSLDGQMHANELQGFFAGDTRVLSTYRVAIGGQSWRVLSRSRPGPSTAQWDMQNPAVRAQSSDIEEGTLHFRLRRRVCGGLHDDLSITSFAERAVMVRFSLLLDADFADIFQVKDRSTPPRLNVLRLSRASGMSFVYERRDFRRALHVEFGASTGRPTFVGIQALFELVLEPKRPWHCCIDAVPELDGKRIEFDGDPHAPEGPSPPEQRPRIDACPLLAAPFERGAVDLQRLALQSPGGPPFIAAGAPWFLALFGRDTLVTSLMGGLLGAWHAEGALAALGATQAQSRDDFRDAQPGKIAHELRQGELARFKAIPHTPYYGTHDAPALFVLALWNAFRWTGNRDLLREHFPAAEAALHWCEKSGDEDGDGFLEYRTRSPRGYFNQGWKDAGDAILHAEGHLAELPIATVELQGYWYAARMAMAELHEAVGDDERAASLRHAARRLRQLVEERFWLEDIGCYALALDGGKRLVRSVSSNPGHLLWCGLTSHERARRVAERLLADDLFTGYGIRTLSAEHPKYNPLSYQCGSVWPHDSALIAAGLSRYGLHDEAARVFRGILRAAETFEDSRLPELFCGFDCNVGEPVPYEKANVPQAWAAAAPILAAQVFLGLLPDVPNDRCYISPWLPEWLPALELGGIQIGDANLEIRVTKTVDGARIEHARHASLELIVDAPAAPLWGAPFAAP